MNAQYVTFLWSTIFSSEKIALHQDDLRTWFRSFSSYQLSIVPMQAAKLVYEFSTCRHLTKPYVACNSIFMI